MIKGRRSFITALLVIFHKIRHKYIFFIFILLDCSISKTVTNSSQVNTSIDVHMHVFSSSSWDHQITGETIIEEMNKANVQKAVGYFIWIF